MHKLTRSCVFTVALTLAAATAGWPAAAGQLGQTVSGDLRIDGVSVPSGTTLLSPTLVHSGAATGLLRLDDDSLLGLDAGSTAYLESTPAGGVQVAVRSGTVSVASAEGESFQLAANSRLVLDPQGQVLEGEAIEMVELCTFDQETDDWELIAVPEPEVADRLAAGDVYPGEEGLDEECNDEDPVVFWTTAKKVGVGIGAAALLGFGIDELNDDDPTTRPASPVTP